MTDKAFWLQVIDTSAAMLGFALVVMGLVIGAHKEKSITPTDARVLMYTSFASFVSFTISLTVGVYLSLSGANSTRIAEAGVLYFGLGFAIILVTLSSIVINWIRGSL